MIYWYFNLVSFFIYLFFVLSFSSCAQKKRSIIPEDKCYQNPILTKIKKIELLSVYGFKLNKKDNEAILTWKAIDESKIKSNLKFVGYNVYRFRCDGFLKNTSLNKSIITSTEFIDKNQRADLVFQYGVKAVFMFGGKLVEGPMSRILCG